jgi:hypothetical protein
MTTIARANGTHGMDRCIVESANPVEKSLGPIGTEVKSQPPRS